MFEGPAWTVADTPLFAIMNGRAAVMLFFVLSGFVLSVRYLAAHDLRWLAPALIKRWPRLAGPVLLANALSALLAIVGLYHQRQLPTPWPRGVMLDSDLAAALYEGAIGAFVHGTSSYNIVIWTMRYELIGSVVTFALAAALVPFGPGARALLLAWTFAAVFAASPFLSCFVAGVALAQFYVVHGRSLVLPWPASIAALALALILFGYARPRGHAIGFYAPLDGLPGDPAAIETALHMTAALLFLGVALFWPRATRAMSGRIAAALGLLSFPIYLTHMLVLFSLTSFAYLALRDVIEPPALHVVLFATTVAGIALASALLAWFDFAWTRLLNRMF